tara:strand:+ start:18473 stop:19765 length:1293 start_codon:yes stop_codon:yes gene_type:complete
MATRTWTGNALPIAQITKWVIDGTWAAGDKFTMTINSKDVTVATTSATISTVASEIATALGESTVNEFQSISWTSTSTQVVGTALVAGVPFTASARAYESDGTTPGVNHTVDGANTDQAGTTSTAATGPNFADNADNWSAKTLPVDDDTIVFENSSVDVLYGLANSSVTPAEIHFKASYTGRVGLPAYDSAGDLQYRDRYLQYGVSGDSTNIKVFVGHGTGAGSSRINLDVGSSQATVTVVKTAEAPLGEQSFNFKGTHSSNVLTVNAGRVGIAAWDGEASTIATLKIGYNESVIFDATVFSGDAVTLGAVDMSGGTFIAQTNITTLTMTNGNATQLDGAIATAVILGGSLSYQTDSTLTNLTIGSTGVFSAREDLRSRTVTNIVMHAGAAFYDPFGTVTATNGYDLVQASIPEVILDTAKNKTWTPSTI